MVLHDSNYFTILYLVYIMYTNLYSMILNHISLQNYFENVSKFKKFPIMYPVSGLSVARAGRPVHSRPDRSTGPVDRALWSGCACLCTSTDWKHFALGFLSVDRAGRPTEQREIFLWLPVDRPVDRVQRLVCQWTVGRPDRSTDSRQLP